MLSSLPVKLAQIGCRLGLGNSSAGCGNDLIEAGRHGKSQQLYGREIESLVIGLSKIGLSTKKSIGNLRRGRRENLGAIEGTRTPTPLRVHGPEPCASANSATMAKSDSVTGRPLRGTFQERTTANILQGRRSLSNVRAAGLQASGFRHLSSNAALTHGAPKAEACRPTRYPSSLAFIVMFALSTLDTGHPLLAFSAAFWKAA